MPVLSDLLVDRARLDEELLVTTLRNLVGIDKETLEIVPGERWSSLNSQQLVVAVLLTRKAMYAMPEVEVESEGLSSSELEVATGLKGGTIRSALKRLKDKTVVAQDPKGRYYVPTPAVPRAVETITGEGK